MFFKIIFSCILYIRMYKIYNKIWQNSRSFVYIFNIVIALFYLFCSSVVFAQEQNTSFSFSTRFPVEGSTVLDGYIVAISENGYAVTTEAYQQSQAGVVTERPAIEVGAENENQTTYPIATSGDALVWVSLSNGLIKRGDPITSSPWEGVGMKATVSGPILGIALADIQIQENQSDIDQVITKVRVSINPRDYEITENSNNLLSNNNRNAINSPDLIRYLVAGTVVLITIVISLNFFGKLSRTGVEALGRNPLAFKKIEFGITINLVVGFLIALIGITVAIVMLN